MQEKPPIASRKKEAERDLSEREELALAVEAFNFGEQLVSKAGMEVMEMSMRGEELTRGAVIRLVADAVQDWREHFFRTIGISEEVARAAYQARFGKRE